METEHTDLSLAAELIRQKSGILLDISFGGTPQPRAVVLGPEGDIRQLPTDLPLRLPDATVHTCVVTHVLEFLDPSQFFLWFDELHRIMQPWGVVYFSGPYGGEESTGWLSDPSHRVRITEQTWAWLDDRTPFYAINTSVGRRLPKPWHLQSFTRVPAMHGTISYNVVLQQFPGSNGHRSEIERPVETEGDHHE